MTKTENFALNQWDPQDPIRREDFNADNAAIDEALAAVRQEAARELAEKVGTVGHTARLLTGTYTGTGTFGPNNPNVLKFQCKPVFLYVQPSSGYTPVTFLRPFAYSHGSGTGLPVTWTDDSVSWYYNTLSATDPVYQLNESGREYQWVAIGYEE